MVYSLRKWLKLALNGNPTVLMLLFLEGDHLVVRNREGQTLQSLAACFASRQAGKRFLGYLMSQKEPLAKSGHGRDTQRPALVEKYGFDTKYAMHLIRLGMQGVEFCETGRMTLPMREPDREYIRGVRLGQVPLVEVMQRAEDLEQRLRHLIDAPGALPPVANHTVVWSWARRVYVDAWTHEMREGLS